MTEEMTFDEWFKKTFKPCPFCGNIPKITTASWEYGFLTELTLSCCMEFNIKPDSEIVHFCGICGERLHRLTGLDPIEKWNRRAKE